ncbi:MAG: tetratricopeptide repeat protein [Chthoniobacterales bacterium]
MIQPLKPSKSSWTVFWVDLDEPLPSGADFILPTLMIVTDERGVPVAPPEMLEELDQTRVENFLDGLIDKLGAPDRLLIGDSDEWDHEAWKIFAQDYSLQLQFTRFSGRDRKDIKILTQKVAETHGGGDSASYGEVAAGLLNSALRVRSESKKIALLKKALDNDADCAGARIELADSEFRAANWTGALRAYDEVIDREYPHWSGRKPKWWTDLATRPYLRAIHGRAMTLWHQQRHSGAAETLADLLEINPRDHQGARFLVPMVHMLADEFDAAQDAFEAYEKNYPNDYPEPSLHFGWALMHAYFGRDVEGLARYRTAILKNIYIAPLLLEAPAPPDHSIWLPSDRAEIGYAREFIESYAVLWDRVPSALRLLREALDESAPLISEIVELRIRMFDFQDQRYEPDYKPLWQELVAQDERLTA